MAEKRDEDDDEVTLLSDTATRARERDAIDPRDEPPVVARLVVEIRSDGSRTIARGAMEDATSGESVAIEAKGTSPLSLALELAKSMVKVRKSFASTAARALLPGRKKKR